jgi:ribosome-associated protein YbcJ (S4-like RNA binding protein)
MAYQSINIGSAANDGTGDPLRTAFDKINDNFTELYTELGGTSLSSLQLSGNALISDVTNENINITPNGTGSVVINSDLEVKGSTTQVNATSFQVEDALIELNRNSSGADVDAGIYIQRGGAGNNAVFYWNEGDDKFKAVTSTSAATVTSVADTATATIVANVDATTAKVDTLQALDEGQVTVNDSMQIRGGVTIDNNDSTSSALLVEGDVTTDNITCDSITVGSNINGIISSANSAQANINEIGDGNLKINTNGEIKDANTNDVQINNRTTNGNIIIQPQGTGGIQLNGPISNGDSTEIVMNDIVNIANGLIVNEISSDDSVGVVFNDNVRINGNISSADSTTLVVQDAVQINGATTVNGALDVDGASTFTVTDNLGTSATALSLTTTIHALTGAETDYTLAAGSEGQIMHFVIAGGDSTAAGTAATTVTISQVRDPRDGDILATYAWQPFINSSSETGDSTVGKRTLATCVFANGAWNLDSYLNV